MPAVVGGGFIEGFHDRIADEETPRTSVCIRLVEGCWGGRVLAERRHCLPVRHRPGRNTRFHPLNSCGERVFSVELSVALGVLPMLI